VRHPLDVRAWVDTEVGEDTRDLDVVWSAQPLDGDTLATEVADRLDTLVADDLLAADVAPGDEDEGVAPIDPGDQSCGVAESEVRGARGERLVVLDGRRLLHIGDVREPLGPQERLRHILRREADARALDDSQPRRLRRRLGGGWRSACGQKLRRPRQRERAHELPSAPALRAMGTHGDLLVSDHKQTLGQAIRSTACLPHHPDTSSMLTSPPEFSWPRHNDFRTAVG